MEYVQRYTVGSKKASAFRRWLVDNKERIQEACPEGVAYLGTFFVVHATADYECETRWRLDGFEQMMIGEEHVEWWKVMDDLAGWVSDLPPRRTVLMKEASDGALYVGS